MRARAGQQPDAQPAVCALLPAAGVGRAANGACRAAGGGRGRGSDIPEQPCLLAGAHVHAHAHAHAHVMCSACDIVHVRALCVPCVCLMRAFWRRCCLVLWQAPLEEKGLAGVLTFSRTTTTHREAPLAAQPSAEVTDINKEVCDHRPRQLPQHPPRRRDRWNQHPNTIQAGFFA